MKALLKARGRAEIVKNIKWRWILIILAGLAAVDNHARNAVNVLETELKLIADRNGICLAGKQLDVVEFEAAGIRKQDETDNKDKEAKETSAEQSNAQNAVNSKEEVTT